jgi:hypothetical protein
MCSMNDSLDAEFFEKSGCEYYALARFAMFAQRPLVCGNLSHHEVEMLLKAGLARHGKNLSESARMGHDLKKLRTPSPKNVVAPIQMASIAVSDANRPLLPAEGTQ